MSHPLIDRAVRASRVLREWGGYSVLLLALVLGLGTSGDWALRGLVTAYDDALVRTPIDNLADETPPMRANQSARAVAREDEARSTAEGFDHARPSPRLFGRIDEIEAERVKASVSERVVAEGSTNWYSGTGHTYTTICVRLCDGAHFPVSYSTTRGRFANDERICKARCAAPARLFVYPNPGGSAETAVDRSGHSYVALPTAFQYKRETTPACSCRPAAWEEASRARHRHYAAAEVGGRSVAEQAASTAAATEQSSASGQRAALQIVNRPHSSGEAWTGTQTASLSADTRVPDVTPLAVATEVATPKPVELVAAAPLAAAPVVAKPVKVATLPSAKKRKTAPGNKRARPSELEAGLFSIGATVGPPGRLELGNFEVRLWGRGPNSVLAPRGSTAGDIFARNFY